MFVGHNPESNLSVNGFVLDVSQAVPVLDGQSGLA